MDVDQIKRSVSFHGVDLLRRLGEEQQQGAPTGALLGLVSREKSHTKEIKSEDFNRQLCAFIAKKSDLLFAKKEDVDKKRIKNAIDDAYAIMPPLETFMDIPVSIRREHFYKSIKDLDCVTGVVSQILEKGLLIRLLFVDIHQPRDIEDLDIMAYCPQKELPKLYAKESALDSYQEKDIVRAIVHSVDVDTERIILSMLSTSLENPDDYPRIGLITDDEFPVHYRRKLQIDDMKYDEMLHSVLGFNNAGNVKALVSELGINESASFLRCDASLKIPEKEYAEGLKKWQTQKLAHQSVAQGVDYFKQGKEIEAMQHFSRALQIDPNNVEALVARGALYANKENFKKAIKDFEDALSSNPNHNNARNYLLETLLTFGKSCEDNRKLEEACSHYNYALDIDSENKEAKELLSGCQRLMAFQKPPIEGEELNVSSLFLKTTEKLKQLIQEDKKKNSASTKKPSKKTWSSSSSESDSSSDRGHSKKRQRRRSSSSSSSNSSERKPKRKQSMVSEDSDRSRKRKGKKRRSSKLSASPGSTKKEHRRYSQNSKNSPFEKSPGAEEFPIKIETITSSFLPLSSKDYFSKSAAIPGLGSPSPDHCIVIPDSPQRKTKLPTKELPQRFQKCGNTLILKKSKSPSPHRSRSNSSTRLQRFRSKSSSRSRSRTRSRSRRKSKSRSLKRLRSRSFSRSPSNSNNLNSNRNRRSRSKSFREKTGVSELDMYLSNIYTPKSASPGILDKWDEFMSQKNKSNPTIKQSRSPRRSLSRSPSPRRSLSRSPSPVSSRFHKHPRYEISPVHSRTLKRSPFMKDNFKSERKEYQITSFEGQSQRSRRLQDKMEEFSKDLKPLKQEDSNWNKEKGFPKKLEGGLIEGNRKKSLQTLSDKGKINLNWDVGHDKRERSHRSLDKSDTRSDFVVDKQNFNIRVINNPLQKSIKEERTVSQEQMSPDNVITSKHSPPISRRIMKMEKIPSVSQDTRGSRDLLSNDVNEKTEDRRVSSKSQEYHKSDLHDIRVSKNYTDNTTVKTVRKPIMDDPDLNPPLVSSNELERRNFEKKEKTRKSVIGIQSDDQTTPKKKKEKKKKRKKDDKKKKKRRSSSGIDDKDNIDSGDELKPVKSTPNKKQMKEKFHSEVDLEKEIERRVKERLMAEEEKLRKALALEKANSTRPGNVDNKNTSDEKAKPEEETVRSKHNNDSKIQKKNFDSDKRDEGDYDDHQKREYVKPSNYHKQDTDENRSTSSYKIENEPRSHQKVDINSKRKSSITDEKNLANENDSESNYEMNPKYIEMKSGWVKDMDNNMYYAVKGKILEPGEHEDKHGNKYKVKAMSKSEYVEAKIKVRLLLVSDEERDQSREHYRNDDRHHRDDDRHRRDDDRHRRDTDRYERQSRDERDHQRDRYNVNYFGNRRPYRGWGRSRGRARGFNSYRFNSRWQRSVSPRSRSSSRSKHGSSSPEARRFQRQRRKSYSRSPKRDRSKRENQFDNSSPRPEKDESIDHSSKDTSENLPLKNKDSETPIPQKSSRWDSKEVQPKSTNADIADGPVMSSRWENAEEEEKEKEGQNKDDSLSNLEKFLKNLKQTKKKQWIAEGKLKE